MKLTLLSCLLVQLVPSVSGMPVGSIGKSVTRPAPVLYLRNTNSSSHGSKITGSYLVSFSGHDVESYRGLPFAQPPVHNLRFKPPVGYAGSYDNFDASGFGKACISVDGETNTRENAKNRKQVRTQRGVSMPLEFEQGYDSFARAIPESEDCLFLNVYKPARINDFVSMSASSTVSNYTNLPVIVWFHGGSFTSGSSNTFRGETIVGESMKLGMPVVYVSVNYRLGPFGFLSSKEMKSANNKTVTVTNAGFLDQRLALEWVQEHIQDFGGDPENVTIAGVSAGAMSVASHMVYNDGDHTYKGKPLFNKAILQSGGLIPFNDFTERMAQSAYDTIVKEVGCNGKSSKTNAIECLQSTNASDIQIAASKIDKSISLAAFIPRVDGKVFKQDPFKSWKQGKFAKVPYIIGNQEDEGTSFALAGASPFGAVPISAQSFSAASLLGHVFSNIDHSFILHILKAYPESPEMGSPFRTSRLNSITPEFKRTAALLGDAIFQAPRRFMTSNTPSDVPVYSYLASTGYGTPYVGTLHASDIVWQYELDFGPSKVYNGYFIAFANNGDVNSEKTKLPYWPKQNEKSATSNSKNMLNIKLSELGFISDTFREEGMNVFCQGF